VYGCLSDYDWCDVDWRGNRGWVFTDYLEYYYRNQPRPVMEWGPRIGLPVVAFSFGEYARRHYRDMPWYSDRDRWYRWDRDRRDRRDRRDDYRNDDDDDNVRYYRERNRDVEIDDLEDDDDAPRSTRRYQADEDAPERRVVTPDVDAAETATGDDDGNMRRMPRGARAGDATPGNRPITRCNPARENCAPGRSQTQGNSTTSDDNNSQQRTDD
jgi:hypothetical protein